MCYDQIFCWKNLFIIIVLNIQFSHREEHLSWPSVMEIVNNADRLVPLRDLALPQSVTITGDSCTHEALVLSRCPTS